MFKFIEITDSIDAYICPYGVQFTVGHRVYITIRKNRVNKFLNKFPLLKRKPRLIGKIKKIIKKYS